MKNKTKITIILACIILGLISTSLAYIVLQLSGEKEYIIDAGYLSLRLDEGTNNITLENAYPMDDSQAETLEPFNFSIVNDGTKKIDYSIYLANNLVQNENNKLENKYLNYSLYQNKDGEEKNLIGGKLSDLEIDNLTIDDASEEVLLIDSGEIEKGEELNYSLRIWLNYDAGNDTQGKMFSSKIYVVGDQIKDKILIYDDKTGANQPDILTGMIPVVYDEAKESWVKADVSNKDNSWFNYAEQQWANVVTVKEKGTRSRIEYQAADIGTEISMDDINTMWVWIPRYSYSIKSEDGKNYYGKGSTSNALPGEIDIKFVDKYTKDSGNALYLEEGKEDWLTHPAFTFGTEELSGIWVAKFETGKINNEQVAPVASDWKLAVIKPDVKSNVYVKIADSFSLSRKLQYEQINVGFNKQVDKRMDTHMMKNSEWTAVTYLTQSKYGKYGNSSYIDAEKEVYINNSSNYYTGRSGGSYSGNTPINKTYTAKIETTNYSYYGYYTYDDYLVDYNTGKKTVKVKGKGTGASTTGTIYGIYDMSGGAGEYLMANYDNVSGYTARAYTVDEAKAANFNGGIATGVSNSGFNGYTYGPGYNEKTGKWDLVLYVTEGIDFPNLKYYDLYGTGSNSCPANGCKGQLIETFNWYNDYNNIDGYQGVWLYRGGYSKEDNAGIFASDFSLSGNENDKRSTRIVISNY